MWPKYASIVKKLVILDTDGVRNDPDVAAFLEKAGERLGRKGKFVLKLSGIPQENSVLAEGRSKKICDRVILEFERLLLKKGYMECEHDWVDIREEDLGEMDYRSDGGPVDRFVVTLSCCRICGFFTKEGRGDCCGDTEEYTEITDDDCEYARAWFEKECK